MQSTESPHTGARLAVMLDGWANGRAPLFRALARALRTLIEGGDLAPGARLPAERDLACTLAISRTTAVAAYDLLAAEGLLTRRQGSGTYVPSATRGPETASPIAGYADKAGANPLFRTTTEEQGPFIDFALAAPHTAGPFLQVALAIDAVELLAASEGHGYVSAGLTALRLAIAQQLSTDGVPTEPSQIMVTQGAQQAIRLLAALYLREGDSAVVEQPTYPGAIAAYRAEGARLLPLNLDGEGAPPDALERLLARNPARIVHVTPSFNNPAGTLTPAPRRRHLAEIAERYQVPLIEDTTIADLGPADSPPPIAAFDRAGCVITIGSLGKLFWGGLRIGWVRAPELVIERLSRMRAGTDLACSALSQLVAARLLQHRAEQREWRRAELRRQLDALSGLLGELLPDWAWQEPTGGIALWVQLPGGSASAFARLALRYGVSVVPGPVFAADGGFDDHLRLPFTLPVPALEEGVRRLAAAWRAYSAAGEPRRPAPSAVV